MNREQINFVGQKILSATFDGDSTITLKFQDGTLSLTDDGQDCCEHRYMVVDDELSQYIGASYQGWTVVDSTFTDEGYDTHEIQFLNIHTSIGDISVANHNVHNGYYGGFYVQEHTYRN